MVLEIRFVNAVLWIVLLLCIIFFYTRNIAKVSQTGSISAYAVPHINIIKTNSVFVGNYLPLVGKASQRALSIPSDDSATLRYYEKLTSDLGRDISIGTGELCERRFAPMDIPMFRHRSDFKHFLESNSRYMKYGAEIGVQRGLFSLEILTTWTGCVEYHLIDPWTTQVGYRDVANVEIEHQNGNMEITQNNLKLFGSVPHFHRNFSSDAAKLFKDCYFDFVYIDGLHDYDGALHDMVDYWRTVRPGGLFAGHDFEDGNLPQGFIPHS